MRIKTLTPEAEKVAARLRAQGLRARNAYRGRMEARANYHRARQALVNARAELAQGDRSVEIGRSHPARLHLAPGWALLSQVVPALETALADAGRVLEECSLDLARAREARENVRAELHRANFRPVSRGEQVARELANREELKRRVSMECRRADVLGRATRALTELPAWRGPDGMPLAVQRLLGSFQGFPVLRWGGLTLAVTHAPATGYSVPTDIALAPLLRDPATGRRILAPACSSAAALGSALQARRTALSAQAAD